jgi:hypothetical protein
LASPPAPPEAGILVYVDAADLKDLPDDAFSALKVDLHMDDHDGVDLPILDA